MGAIARYMKEKEPDCKIVFIGPCTAKKMEFQKETVHPYIDCVITFEELQALFDSKDIDITTFSTTLRTMDVFLPAAAVFPTRSHRR